MANGISWGAVAIGTAIGGAIVYGVMSYRKKEEEAVAKEKEKKQLKPTKPSKIPEVPVPSPEPGKLGDKMPGRHRAPKPEQKVWIPQTNEDRRDLDKVICEIWNTYEAPPEPSDFTMDVLDEVASEGDWPTVPGDHASLHSLQAIVGFRIDEIGQLDSTKSIEENFDAFCIAEGVMPPGAPGQITPVP